MGRNPIAIRWLLYSPRSAFASAFNAVISAESPEDPKEPFLIPITISTPSKAMITKASATAGGKVGLVGGTGTVESAVPSLVFA